MALSIADNSSYYSPPSSEISMLYTFLPTAVKSRLPMLSSFRRSLKMTTTRRSTPSHSRQSSQDSIPGVASLNNAYINPTDEMVTQEQLWQVSGQTQDLSHEIVASTSSTLSSAASSSMAAPLDRALAFPIQDTRTGIEWDTAVTALMLLSRACSRAQQPDTKPENTRALIVDANKWLLRSLPDQLDPRELEELEEVMPGSFDEPDREPGRRRRRSSRVSSPEKHSWLRRVIAYVILQISLSIALIIPYLRALANQCYRLERRNHIAERLLTRGIDITTMMGESGMEVKDAMLRLGRGRLVNAVAYTAGWVVESVIGGVTDGAGEGVAIVGKAMLSQQRWPVQ